MLPSLTGLIMVTASFAHLSLASASHSYDEDTEKEKLSLLFALGAMPLCISAFTVSHYRRGFFFFNQMERSAFENIKPLIIFFK